MITVAKFVKCDCGQNSGQLLLKERTNDGWRSHSTTVLVNYVCFVYAHDWFTALSAVPSSVSSLSLPSRPDTCRWVCQRVGRWPPPAHRNPLDDLPGPLQVAPIFHYAKPTEAIDSCRTASIHQWDRRVPHVENTGEACGIHLEDFSL